MFQQLKYNTYTATISLFSAVGANVISMACISFSSFTSWQGALLEPGPVAICK